MNSKVVVLADEATQAVVNVSTNNPEYGYIRVQQIRTMIDDNGFLRRKPVSALIPGTLAELKDSGFFAGQQLDGKIVVEESLEPFNEKTPERDLKIAGETGVVCTLGGLPIYRRTKFSFDGNGSDTLIKHDNVEQLRAAYAAQNGKSSAIRPNVSEDFSIGG
jgi:hypothetical protein